MGNLAYLLAAYSIIWLAVVLYTLSLGRRQARLAEEVALLGEMLRKQQGQAGR